MRKLLSTFMILLSLAAMAIASPKVQMPQTTWDFGNVPQNATIEHEYWIKNIGSDTLKIISVKPG